MVSGRAARAAGRGLVRPRPRAQGRLSVHAGGRPRAALVVDLRRQPGRLLRAPDAVRDQGRGAREARSRFRSGRRASTARERMSPWSPPAGSCTSRSRRRRRPTPRASRSRSSTRARCCRWTRRRSCRRWRRRLAAWWRTRRLRTWGSAPRLRRSSSTELSTIWTPRSSAPGAKFAPIPFAPVMENYVVPHAADVLEAIQRTVRRDG